MGHVQGHAAVIVGDMSPDYKRLVEVEEGGIAMEGLGEEVGLEDGRRILKGDEHHKLQGRPSPSFRI